MRLWQLSLEHTPLIAEHYSGGQEILLLIAIVFFFLSAFCAIFGIIPYKGIIGVNKYFEEETPINKLPIDEFICKRFYPDDS